MTQFQIIKPKTREAFEVQCEELHDAIRQAGLDPAATDHGMVMRSMGIVVYEFGLFDPPAEQSYFSLLGRLYAGNAVLYGVGPDGGTVDLKTLAIPFWLPTVDDVEKAIAAGLCPRPQMSVNGDAFWNWPQPAPEGIKRG
jgi:hypothetical protein